MKFPDLELDIWYLDDGNIKLKINQVPKFLKLIKDYGEPLGLFLNIHIGILVAYHPALKF
jgi:uncharacterized membrane protein (UPF0127 family)